MRREVGPPGLHTEQAFQALEEAGYSPVALFGREAADCFGCGDATDGEGVEFLVQGEGLAPATCVLEGLGYFPVEYQGGLWRDLDPRVCARTILEEDASPELRCISGVSTLAVLDPVQIRLRRSVWGLLTWDHLSAQREDGLLGRNCRPKRELHAVAILTLAFGLAVRGRALGESLRTLVRSIRDSDDFERVRRSGTSLLGDWEVAAAVALAQPGPATAG